MDSDICFTVESRGTQGGNALESIQSASEEVLGDELSEQPACLHHWVIEKPAGPTSKGACRECGEERDFQNYIEGSSWRYDVSLEQLSGGSRLPKVDLTAAREESALEE